MAFTELKRGLMEAPILGYPDPTKSYVLDTDASAVGVGAVPSQVQQGHERVIAYYSKTLADAERNYCVTRREPLAIVKAVKHFRPYLYGRSFKLRTDHASLRWLCKRHQPSAQVARWLEILSEFKFELEQRSGIKHGNADGLSRRSQCYDCKQCNAIEKRDGGPSRRELDLEWAFPNTSLSEEVRSETLTDKKLSVQDSLGETSGTLVTVVRDKVSAEIVQLVSQQSSGDHAVGMVYRSLQSKEDLSSDILQQGNCECSTSEGIT